LVHGKCTHSFRSKYQPRIFGDGIQSRSSIHVWISEDEDYEEPVSGRGGGCGVIGGGKYQPRIFGDGIQSRLIHVLIF
jgi:hypothetical protein